MKNSPWGAVQHEEKIMDGIVLVSTASHGGLKVYHKLNKLIPDDMRRADGWYEEDCDWAIVATVFPMAFPDDTEAARFSLKHWHWKEYERYYGVELQPGESRLKDQWLFEEAHKNDFQVVSAIQKDERPGFVYVRACRGGRSKYADRTTEKAYWIPEAEYTIPFIVDTTRHEEATA